MILWVFFQLPWVPIIHLSWIPLRPNFFWHNLFLVSVSGQQNLCHIHLVTFNLISILATDYIQIDIKLRVTTWRGHQWKTVFYRGYICNVKWISCPYIQKFWCLQSNTLYLRRKLDYKHSTYVVIPTYSIVKWSVRPGKIVSLVPLKTCKL